MKEGNESRPQKKTPDGIIGKILSNDKALTIIVIVGLIGIGMIFISSYIRPPAKESSAAADESSAEDSLLEQYRSSITEELGNMLASMDGVGRTKIMITLDGGVRNIYATDTDINGRETSRKNGDDENADKQNTEKRSCILVRNKDGTEKALTVGKMMPSVKGVLIVCDGGDDEGIIQRVREAVSAALDISQTHICVSKLG